MCEKCENPKIEHLSEHKIAQLPQKKLQITLNKPYQKKKTI